MSVLWTLITPAFIASVVSIFINVRTDKIKANRDNIGLMFSDAATAVEVAVIASATYFSQDSGGRTAQLEASVWLSERELRFHFPLLITAGSPTLAEESAKLQSSFDDLIAELTGGSFQSVSASADLKHVRRIASIGAELRYNLRDVRRKELQNALRKDPITRFITYWTGVPSYIRDRS